MRAFVKASRSQLFTTNKVWALWVKDNDNDNDSIYWLVKTKQQFVTNITQIKIGYININK